jgi:SAM-dependent methyltransferase
MQCGNCKLVFVPVRYHLSPEEEKSEYDLHENDPADSGYRKFLSRLSEPVLKRLNPRQRGLDFGCGPGPALAAMMRDRGHSMDLYDLFYYRDDSVFKKKYDFITSTEVVEHLSHPGLVFTQLFQMLNPGGYLGIMTKLVKDQNAFRKWHYIQDPTHICFFSRLSFDYLADKYSSEIEIIGSDVIIFKKSGVGS